MGTVCAVRKITSRTSRPPAIGNAAVVKAAKAIKMAATGMRRFVNLEHCGRIINSHTKKTKTATGMQRVAAAPT